MSDLVQRLRADIETWEGHYSGEMFVRYFPPPPLQLEAAKQIEDDEALMRQVLEVLEKYRKMMFVEAGCRFGEGDAAITALRERLEETK